MYIVARVHLYVPDHNAGSERMLHTMLRALASRGHRCEVYTTRYSAAREPYVLDGVKVYPAFARSDFGTAARAADVLVTHHENTFSMAAMASKLRKPLVQLMHNIHPESRTWLTAKADLVVFNSESMRDDMGGHPNGIVVHPPIMAEDYRTTPGHAVTLVNLNDVKGEDVFWELARRMPDVEFLGVKGAYGTQVTHDLPNVEVLSHRRRMRDVYAISKIVIMPSAHETWGMVATEAMVSGIPVIATPTPGLRENLGAAGTFVERDDLDGWEREIRRLLKPAAWGKASKAALKRADELDPAESLNRWCDAVEALGDRRPLAIH